MFSIPQTGSIAKSATATLTIAELASRIITTSGAVAISLTLPTGTLCDAGLASGNLRNDENFNWSIVNTGTAAALVTLIAGTGHTIEGSTLVAIGTSGRFTTRKTTANTFITYRIA